MQVKDVCTRRVVTIGRAASVQEAADLMRTLHVGDLVVVEERNGARTPVGILTDRDIVLAVVADEVDPRQVTVGDAMTFELATVRDTDSWAAAIEAMRDAGVRRMPVLDEDGALTGMVTLDDMLILMADLATELARLVTRERRQEEQARA